MRLAACALGIAALALTSCQNGQAPAARRLTAADVQSVFVGMTNYGTGQDGKRYVSYIAPDGSIRIRGDGYADSGQYRIESDGRICIRYRKLRDGAEICQTVWRQGDRWYAAFSDNTGGIFIDSRKPGNAEGL
jgi:hypothetical protein